MCALVQELEQCQVMAARQVAELQVAVTDASRRAESTIAELRMTQVGLSLQGPGWQAPAVGSLFEVVRVLVGERQSGASNWGSQIDQKIYGMRKGAGGVVLEAVGLGAHCCCWVAITPEPLLPSLCVQARAAGAAAGAEADRQKLSERHLNHIKVRGQSWEGKRPRKAWIMAWGFLPGLAPWLSF